MEASVVLGSAAAAGGAQFGGLGPFAVALALGLGVGLERGWSKRGDEQQAIGSRTFALLGLAGCVAAALGVPVVAAGLVPVAGLVVAGYLRTGGDDHGTTTEFAAVIVYLLGALAWERAAVAVGLAVLMAALLLARGPVHRFAREVITQTEVEDAVRFFVIAFVVLPILPDRAMGPYGIVNPSHVWLIVVALTAIGWVGYIAVRMLGPTRGLLVTGFAGGFISATATTAALARRAKLHPEQRPASMAGALMASVATYVQLGLMLAVVSRELLAAAAPMLAAGLVAMVAVTVARVGTSPTAGAAPASPEADDEEAPDRPFALGPALVLAALLTVVLVAVRWASEVVGRAGTVLVTGLAGFADVHAAVISMATVFEQGDVAARTALLAAGAAFATNTVSKLVVAGVAGGPSFALRFGALLVVPVVVTGGTLWLTLP